MVDAKLNVDATSSGFPERKAEVEDLKGAINDAASATQASTAAEQERTAALTEQEAAEIRQAAVLKEHKALLDQLAAAQAKAAASVAAMADAADAGGAKYRAAIDAAAAAVARLEIIQDEVRAKDGPIGPEAVAQLEVYNGAIAAADASTQRAANSTTILRGEAQFASGSVGGLARGLANLGSTGDGVVASFARMALNVGLFIGVAAVVPELIGKIDDKTKSWAESIVDSVNGLTDQQAAVRGSNESLEEYEARIQRIANEHADLVRSAIAVGAGLLEQAADNKQAIAEWQGHEAALHGALEQYPQFVAALKAMGVSFKATFSDMKDQSVLFGEAYQRVLREDGIAGANAWAEANKTVLDKIISYYERAHQEIPPALLDIARSIGLVSAAEKEWAADEKLQQKIDQETAAFQGIQAAILKTLVTYGDTGIAVTALSKNIDTLIKSLETQLESTGNLTDEQARELDQLKIWRDQVTAITPAVDAATSAVDAHVKKIADLSKALADNAVQFQNNIAKIEAHREQAILDADAIATKTIASYQAQTVALKEQLDAGEIDYSTYVTKVNTLVAAESVVKQKAYEQEQAINAEADKQRDETVQKDTEAKSALEKNLATLNQSYESAQKVREAYFAQQAEGVKALQQEQELHGTDAAATTVHSETVRSFTTDVKGSVEALADHTTHLLSNAQAYGQLLGPIGSVRTELQGLKADADAAAAALDKITSGSGAAAPASGGPEPPPLY